MLKEIAPRQAAIEKLKKEITRYGIQAALVSNPYDIKYLAGFYSENTLLYITKGASPCYFVDAMNSTLLESIFHGTKINVVTAPRFITSAVAEHIRRRGAKKIIFDSENLSISMFDRFSSLLPKVEFLRDSKGFSLSSFLQDIRKIKSPQEIMFLRKAAKETVRIWCNIKKEIKKGMSEIEIGHMIDLNIRSSGYENSFSTIVAVGENSAYPHAVPTNKRLKDRDHVLIDFGIKLGGYCSDLTRVYSNGRINRQIADFHYFVQKVQDLAIKEIKAGAVIKSIADKAYKLFSSNKLSKYILHGLGHGLGLSIHEKPFLRQGSTEQLLKDMVITVEPGLYKKGLGGIRIEDMVLVTAAGCEVLTA